MFATSLMFAVLIAAYWLEVKQKQSKADCILGVVYNLMICIAASHFTDWLHLVYVIYVVAFMIGLFGSFLLIVERFFNYCINPIFGDPQRFDFGFLLRNYEPFFRLVSMAGVSGVLILNQTPLEGRVWAFLAITFVRIVALPNLEDPPNPPRKRGKFDWRKWYRRRIFVPIPIPNN
jgi:hypothetical protein